MTATIASPLTLKSGLTLPNRLVKAAMTERLADDRNNVTDRHLRLYQTWAEGGVGLQITGNVQIDRYNLEAAGNVVIDGPQTPDQMVKLKAWAAAAKSGGGAAMVQLSHAGRQTPKDVNPHPVSASDVALDLPGGLSGQPRAMTEAEIRHVIDRFALAARICREAGFDGVQIHAAHGYLVSQFLSPRSNRRADRWGGSLENRARLLLKIVHAVKNEAGPGFAVAVKLNSADFQKGGFSEDDSMAVIDMLDRQGLDFIEISGGTYEQPRMFDTEGLKDGEGPPVKDSTRKREAYFLDYAAKVQARVSVPLMVTGGFRSADAMNGALANSEADLIGLGRPLCADPDAPKKLLSGEVDALPRWENTIRIGPGVFGPNSSIPIIRVVNALSGVHWFYYQIHEIADGKAPNTTNGGWPVFVKFYGLDKKMAKAYRKALKEDGRELPA
ncbi:NADH:flavin oxidoreductase/NADH oxidase family protein [Hyphobacterium sp.]|uniref:NADH:flavin oxidoreductase/NADH oxidase family protein n=1 Tax=Hyphobacterium sp. TaxID=2004662 RepID=UPI003BAB6C4B